MTRVDFYILEQEGAGARERFACRLAEKAFSQGRRVYLHVADAAAAERLDGLLWTFRAGSFVPHGRLDARDGPDADAPVHIGYGEEPHDHEDVLINMTGEVPLFFSRFHRVAEVLDADAQVRAQGRERFRFYRERGYPLETHNLDGQRG